MSARRRRRPKAAGLRPFWFVGSAILLVAIVAGYFIVAWPGFRVRSVRVTGNLVVPTAQILARAQIDRRRNVWLQSAGAMARRIEKIPYILVAHVHRRLPADVTISVTERTPFAVLRSGGQSALVDASMRVLDDDTSNASTLPVISLSTAVPLVPGAFLTQPDAVAMRSALLSLRAHGVSVEELDDDAGDVRAVLSGGVRVLLGDEANANQAIPLVAPILTRFTLLGRYVGTLDLRSPTTPVVTERGAGVRVSRRAKPAARRSP